LVGFFFTAFTGAFLAPAATAFFFAGFFAGFGDFVAV